MPFRTSSRSQGFTNAPTKPGRVAFAALAVALLLNATPANAQQTLVAMLSAAGGQAPAQQGGSTVHGTVADPDDAEIPGATVTLTPASGKAITTTSGSDGTYTLRNVPPGTYSVSVTMPGFASFARQGVKIAAGTPLTLNAKLAIQAAEQTVNVTTTQNQVSVASDSNASSTILTGKDLDALSDDPDELSSELTALAGPSSGPNGGQIYIDGFTGGQLPPKASIREIRINQNPFSAQYDKPGFGRIEIFTKPGTDKFHGSAQTNFQDKAFNTGSPFVGTAPQPAYHTIFFFGNLTGPLNKSASFTLGGSYRDIQNNSIVNPPAIYSTSQTSPVACYPTQAGCSVFQTLAGNGFTFAQLVPQTRWDITPRIDFAIGSKNTMTIRYQYTYNDQFNQGIDALDLPSTGYNQLATESTIQISDTEIFNAKVINEIHFEYQRPTTTVTPASTAPYVSVQGAFNGGGSNTGGEQDIQQHIEYQNYTSISLAKNFIRIGGRLRTTSDNNTSNAGSNGIFNYTSIANYVANSPEDFTITQFPHPTVSTRTTDVGLYAETDWKARPNWTISYGARFETQNFIHDHADFAPRVSTAYGVTKKTVLRGGFGLFYDRFLLPNQLNVVRNNGVNQTQFTVTSQNSNASTIPTSCTPTNVAACLTAATASELTVSTISPNLRAPYTMQANIGVDQQLFRNATMSVNYQHIRGVHQFVSNATNPPSLASPTAASTTVPLDYQYESEGEFDQNQLIANVNIRNFHQVSLFGYYALNFANSDTAGIGTFASVPNDIKADYGRASFDIRNRIFVGGSYTAPHLITFSPLIQAQSGTPYNITSGLDTYSDDIINSRAVFAPAGSQPDVVNGYVKTIKGCGTFATPGQFNDATPVPINYCTGPANWTMNLRVVKTFGFGERTGPRPDRQQGQGGGNRPPPGAGGPGGGGRGGGGGGFGGGGASSGRRYNLSIGAQAQNIFNIVDRSVPVGTLTSPSFGTSTTLAGGQYTTDSAVRRIYLQAGFTF
jgi:uncharacterized membrane protein YgcG